MSYDASKLTRLAALKALAVKTKEATAALELRIQTLENSHGESNKLEGVKVNGTALTIASKMVDILIATGSANGTIKVNGTNVSVYGLAALAYKSQISESELNAALKATITGKADKATTIAGYGITDAYTKAQVDGIISSVYKPAGSVAFASLPTPGAAVLGKVYNVTDAFTTTTSFVEGAGKKHQAGTNVVVVQDGNGYKFDVLSGFVDLSGYAQTTAMNTALAKKADKIVPAAAGNLAALDSNGNLSDSGKAVSSFVAAESGKRLMTDAEGTKLAGIATGANKYTHPAYTARTSGLYKITVDDTGHVNAVTAVSKSDITALGIPGVNTTYAPATSTTNGLMTSTDKAKLDGMSLATDSEVTEVLNEVFGA